MGYGKAECYVWGLLVPPSAQTEVPLGLTEVTLSCEVPGLLLQHRSVSTPLVNKALFLMLLMSLSRFHIDGPRSLRGRKLTSRAKLDTGTKCLLPQLLSSPPGFKPCKGVYSQTLSYRRCSQPSFLCLCPHAILHITFLAVCGGIPASSKLQMLQALTVVQIQHCRSLTWESSLVRSGEKFINVLFMLKLYSAL